jgi:hypothetical protein
MKKFLHILPLILLSITVPVLAQSDPEAVSPETWDLSFSKQNITWDWRGRLLYNKNYRNGTGISIKHLFTSNLILPGSADRQLRDEHNFSGYFFRADSTFDYGMEVRSWFLADQPSSGITRFSNHSIGGKLVWHPEQTVNLAASAGYQRAENRTHIEWGWDAGLDGKLANYQLGDYRADADLQSNVDIFEKRSNHLNTISVRLKTQFSSVASDSVALSYLNDRKKYYSDASDRITDLLLENKSLYNALYYGLQPNARLELYTILSQRNIRDIGPFNNNDRDVQRFENRLNYRMVTGRLSMLLGLYTHQEIQDNDDIQTDSRALQTTLRSDLNWQISRNDAALLQFSFVKFQYDTPDSLSNHDDRDEQRFITLLGYMHRFSDFLQWELEAYANFFHQIYIFQEQSANNNWNRIYRLKSAVDYRNGRFSNRLVTQVLANYTEYDFEDLFSETRSFVFRKYMFSDSLITPVIGRTSLGGEIRIELEDKGTFFSRDFAQRVLQSTSSYFYDIFVRQEGVFRMIVDLGFTLYRRKDWRHMPVKTLDREIVTTNPYLKISYPAGQRLRLYSYISMTTMDDKGRAKSSYITGKLNFSWRL